MSMREIRIPNNFLSEIKSIPFLDHLILSLEKEHGEEWISAAVADICTEAVSSISPGLFSTLYYKYSHTSKPSYFDMMKCIQF